MLSSNQLREQISLSLEYTIDTVEEGGRRFGTIFRNANTAIEQNEDFTRLCNTYTEDKIEHLANVDELYGIYNKEYKMPMLENNFDFYHVSLMIPENKPIITEMLDINKEYKNIFSSGGIYSDRLIKDKEWYKETVKDDSIYTWFKEEENYCCAHAIYDISGKNIVAIAVIVIDMPEMRRYISNKALKESNIYFIGGDYRYIYGDTQSLPEYIKKINLNKKFYNTNGKVIVGIAEWNPDFYIITVSEKKQVFAALYSIQRQILATSLIIIFFSSIALFFITYRISKPVTDLCDFLLKNDTNPKNMPNLKRSREMTVLTNALKMYIERINKLTEENLKYEKEKNTYEITALEHQINPHFVYNVLNSISAKAMYGQYDDSISEVCSDIAYIMRYNAKDIYKEKPFKYELLCIEKYIDIYRNIYDANISLCIDVDEEIQKMKMIKYIIQPIVENSIIHGSNNQYEININITTRIEADTLYITVKDDGNGFDYMAVNELLYSNEPKTNGMHTGIVNVHKRIELRYGKGYGIRYCENNSGTTAEILLPIRKEDSSD